MHLPVTPCLIAWGSLIPLLVVLLFGCFLAGSLILSRRREKRRIPAPPASHASGEPESLHAVVIGMRCGVLKTGTAQSPDHLNAFEAEFLLDNGTKRVLFVDEDTYEGLQEGLSGTLVIQNGYFLGFEPDWFM
ncbi:DUF2500 domain-containing protein [Ruminococcus champanellensis]|uniref:DUF2500 domain-containing protein n=1 Tax=Ruminococcus champanellensis (strain DSM 18848 / JCM 17042 / KCTC 15320 / 18P13) TaxID=213810 RepID=D4LAA2_RUMC1|nr:DUF2500 family protein [Ruminococcus champanellensis]CBL16547.1 Protein of unknown function (DUF2500) [Ruminococcus champanellensis 18P13 = JCM 17042]